MGVLYAVRKAYNASSNLSDQEARFSPMVLSRILFKPRFDTSTCPLSANHGALESPRKVTILSVSRGNVSLIPFGLSTFSYGFSNWDRWSAARWIEKTEMVFTVSKCIEANKVVFAVVTFQDRALTWWNSQVATLWIEAVTRKTWAEMKVMMTDEFYPPEEIKRMECKLWNLRVKEMDISSYTTRLNELVILCPGMMAHTLMEHKLKAIAEREADNKKRKWENFQGGSSSGGGNSSNRNNNNYLSNQFMKCSPITFRENEGAVCLIRWIEKTEMVFTNRKWEKFQGGSSSGGGNNNSNQNNNNYNSNHNYNNNRNNNQNQYQNPNRNHQNNQRQGNVGAMTTVVNQNTNEAGQNVKCIRCGMQQYENCPIKCNKCGKIGHKTRDCWSKVVATDANAQAIMTCYGCREKGHIKTNCPARNNPGRN
nr:hypothetical protein [Tanacetum cinerariifolium]